VTPLSKGYPSYITNGNQFPRKPQRTGLADPPRKRFNLLMMITPYMLQEKPVTPPAADIN